MYRCVACRWCFAVLSWGWPRARGRRLMFAGSALAAVCAAGRAVASAHGRALPTPEGGGLSRRPGRILADGSKCRGRFLPVAVWPRAGSRAGCRAAVALLSRCCRAGCRVGCRVGCRAAFGLSRGCRAGGRCFVGCRAVSRCFGGLDAPFGRAPGRASSEMLFGWLPRVRGCPAALVFGPVLGLSGAIGGWWAAPKSVTSFSFRRAPYKKQSGSRVVYSPTRIRRLFVFVRHGSSGQPLQVRATR